ncbi:MAG: hypothetical protein ACD_13C00090G0002 [uncultured bacterium]|nr:MAG: hypothetical protein ACD_13C00090G0002 [uncultured bacterium]
MLFDLYVHSLLVPSSRGKPKNGRRKDALMPFFYKTYLSQGRKPSGILLFHSVSTSFPSLAQDVLFNEKEQIGKGKDLGDFEKFVFGFLAGG